MTIDGKNKSIKIYDTEGTERCVPYNTVAPIICSEDYLTSLSRKEISNRVILFKNGRVSNVQTARVDVAMGVTNPYVFPADAGEQMRVVSSSTNDNPLGTGAHKIVLEYLDANFDEQTEEVTLDGTNPVNTVATNIRRINDVYVSAADGLSSTAGNITVYHLSNATPIYGYIETGYTHSRQMIYTVPRAKTLYVFLMMLSSGVGNTGAAFQKLNYCIFTTYFKCNPWTGEKTDVFHPYTEIGLCNNSFHLDLKAPTRIPEMTDLKFMVGGDTAAATICTASLRGWLEPNS